MNICDDYRGKKPSFEIPTDLHERVMQLEGPFKPVKTFIGKVGIILSMLKEAIDKNPKVAEIVVEQLAKENWMSSKKKRYQVHVDDEFWELVNYFQKKKWNVLTLVGRPMHIVYMLTLAFCEMYDDGSLSIDMTFGKIQNKRKRRKHE